MNRYEQWLSQQTQVKREQVRQEQSSILAELVRMYEALTTGASTIDWGYTTYVSISADGDRELIRVDHLRS